VDDPPELAGFDSDLAVVEVEDDDDESADLDSGGLSALALAL
jgi:hypothetical protein